MYSEVYDVNRTLMLEKMVEAIRAAKEAERAASACWVRDGQWFGCSDPERYRILRRHAAVLWQVAWLFAEQRYRR